MEIRQLNLTGPYLKAKMVPHARTDMVGQRSCRCTSMDQDNSTKLVKGRIVPRVTKLQRPKHGRSYGRMQWRTESVFAPLTFLRKDRHQIPPNDCNENKKNHIVCPTSSLYHCSWKHKFAVIWERPVLTKPFLLFQGIESRKTITFDKAKLTGPKWLLIMNQVKNIRVQPICIQRLDLQQVNLDQYMDCKYLGSRKCYEIRNAGWRRYVDCKMTPILYRPQRFKYWMGYGIERNNHSARTYLSKRIGTN